MNFHVNPGDGLPIYRQIMRQVIDAIADGQLSPGARLPTHRGLSEELAIAPLTVKKAYDELERAGYIQQARALGTFVRDELPKVALAEHVTRVEEAVRALLRQAALAGLDLHDVIALVEVIHHERADGPSPGPRP